MPSGSGDNAQQPINSSFPAASMFSQPNIWGPSRSSHDSSAANPIRPRPEPETKAIGSSALNTGSEAVPWSTTWSKGPATSTASENVPRTVSTSPNRTRENGFYDPASAAIGMKSTGFAANTFSDDTNGFSGAYRQRRSPKESSLLENRQPFQQQPVHDRSAAPSRQSQGSPAYNDYRGHTPNNSMSHRPMHHHSASASFSVQSNQRAWNSNHINDDLSLEFARRAALDDASNPTSRQSQLNPDSQPWALNPSSSLAAFNGDVLSGGMQRQPADTMSPASAYRMDMQNGQRGFGLNQEQWASVLPPRDTRGTDIERRAGNQPPQLMQGFNHPYYNHPYPYNMQAQFNPSFADHYSQTFRHGGIAPYTVPGIPNFPLAPSQSNGQDPSRSALMHDFRTTGRTGSGKKGWELRDIYNHVVEFSGDQHGSRFIQQKLETANSDEKEQVFRELEPNAIPLTRDVFGNYVVQKFFEHGNQVQKRILADKLRGKMFEFSCENYACRVVQKAMEHVLVEQQAELVQELAHKVIETTRNTNGNHVMQKIIEQVPREHIGFIMDSIRGQVSVLAAHQYACRVIQRLLEHGSEDDKTQIMDELHPAVSNLISDQYGNYVIQHVLKKGKPQDRAKVIKAVLPQVNNLSRHKYASNVVETCLEYGSPEDRSNIREQLVASGGEDKNNLLDIMKDSYGNYVIQSLLKQLEGNERAVFQDDVKSLFPMMKKTTSIKQMQALEKIIAESADQNGTNSTAPTPVLTNETNSPQSSSPSSLHVSAVGAPTGGEINKAPTPNGESVGPRVQDQDA
jgi:mRNA-binding protein PUF3